MRFGAKGDLTTQRRLVRSQRRGGLSGPRDTRSHIHAPLMCVEGEPSSARATAGEGEHGEQRLVAYMWVEVPHWDQVVIGGRDGIEQHAELLLASSDRGPGVTRRL
jgi:hypothetical protein